MIRVESGNKPYPIRVDYAEFEYGLGTTKIAAHALTLKEAEVLAEALTAKIEEIREADESYVQVKFGTFGRNYTYRDPSRMLQVGDLIEVSRTSRKAGVVNVATVVALGRGNWTGPVKDIVARFDRVELDEVLS